MIIFTWFLKFFSVFEGVRGVNLIKISSSIVKKGMTIR